MPAKQHVCDFCESRANCILESLLDLVKNLEGNVQSEDEKRELFAALSNTKTMLDGLGTSFMVIMVTPTGKAAAESENIPEESNEDFEDLAEKELLAAAKIIEKVKISFSLFSHLFRPQMTCLPPNPSKKQ
jgi:hypothetical protein